MNTLAPFLHHSLSLTLILLLACPSTMIEAPLDDTVGLDPNLELSGDVTIGDTGAPPGEGEGYDEFFFETTCPEEARQGQIVTCTINLYPPGRYEIRVPNPPKGMALDTDQLLLNWTPSTEQSGLYQFSVEVFRSAFSRKSQAVQIFIPSDDLAGGVDLCKGYVLEGKDYTCTVSRFHATLGGDLTYILLEAPPGMTIDEHQGLLEWTPPTNAEDQLVSVTVRGDNGTKTEDCHQRPSSRELRLQPEHRRGNLRVSMYPDLLRPRGQHQPHLHLVTYRTSIHDHRRCERHRALGPNRCGLW